MQVNIRQYMRVGLVHFMAYPSTMHGQGPIEETIRAIALDDYFDAIEIAWIKDPQIRKRVHKILQTSHLSVAYGGQPRLLTTGLNINSLEDGARQQALEMLYDGIDEAYEMDAEGFAFLSGKFPKDRAEDAYAALIDSTRKLCAYAKERGNMRVALEVFDYDIDKRSLIGPVGLALRFARDISALYDNFGLMVDCSHIPMLRETWAENLSPIQEYIIHAHMGNTVIASPALPAYGDMHPRFGFPGSENDVKELAAYLRQLMAIGFLNDHNRPIVSFEVKPWENEEPELVIANAKRTLNAAWALV